MDNKRPQTPNDLVDAAMREADAAMRQATEAISSINFAGIADTIGKAARDVGRELGILKVDSSPYIICEKDARKKAKAQVDQGTAMMVGSVFLFLISLAVIDRSLVFGLIWIAAGVVLAREGRVFSKVGKRQMRFAKVLTRVSEEVGNHQKIGLSQLAQKVEVPVHELSGIVDEAIQKGLIPEGYLDADGDAQTLYLTSAAWKTVHPEATGTGSTVGRAARGTDAPDFKTKAGRDFRGKRKAKFDGRSCERNRQGSSASQDLPAEAANVVSACEKFVVTARECQEQIHDAQVRASLEGCASKVEALADYVGRHPACASELRRLVTYYLPTTEKLALGYVELQDKGKGPQANSTRQELKETLSMVDDSLSKLTDNLLREQSWDLKSDMDVMRTMLEQDGLSDGD